MSMMPKGAEHGTASPHPESPEHHEHSMTPITAEHGTSSTPGQIIEDYGRRALDAGREGLQKGKRLLRDNPAAGVLAAFGAGFVLGLILKRS